ncbi:polyphosphate polymerase domain-containing protein [Draconibacterium sp. IB214405]|uniref:polyphosphate polymerase domain-containing protein n=1 Tax=Draconibacterium sp. IB214405 TaxID=3097352 RepID=UPI002A100CC8|nr:polyphosphate polymerase domain-containing protein [Draconibacterium sp. IB214405]MDX8339793.1 polyphosphate polymerase domain-containing protein [Draconibacterium sp. IB214405]
MQITSLLQRFEAISLDEMDDVALLNRFDSKYQLSVSKLSKVLEAIKDDYFILEIEGKRKHKYSTIYYDTGSDELYTSHHNGRLNRLKIRKREYLSSGMSFLEIKRKNNKGKTRKLRMVAENKNSSFTLKELDFLSANTNFDFILSNFTLPVKNTNAFERITLVNKDYSERCTIDLSMVSYSKNRKVEMDSMAIVELKQGSVNEKTPLAEALNQLRIKPQGFSKYCIGRAFLEPDLKQNLFKERLIQLKKQFNGSIVLKPTKNSTTSIFNENKKNNGSVTGYDYKRATKVVGH